MDDGHQRAKSDRKRVSVFGRRDLDLHSHGIPTYSEISHDEVSIGRLCRGLLREWRAMAIVICIGAALSIALSLYLPKTYLIESTLRIPNFGDLGDLNKQTIVDVTPEDALLSVIGRILSPDEIEQVLVTSVWWDNAVEGNSVNIDSIVTGIRGNLMLTRVSHDYYELGKDEKTPFREVRVSLSSPDPQMAADFLQLLISAAHTGALVDFKTGIQSIRQNRIESIQKQLESLAQAAKRSREAEIIRLRAANNESIARLRQQINLELRRAKLNRENRIIQLAEALRTAESLNIQEPVTWDDLRPLRELTQITNELGSKGRTAPLYFRGARLLKAELDSLKNRKDDRPFISGLIELENELIQVQNDPRITALESRTDDAIYVAEFDELQRQLTHLDQQSTRFDSAQVAIVSQVATVPGRPMRSPLKIILIGIFASGFLALIVGILLVAIRNSSGTPTESG
jgi:LPS O-antigen subunit length determinant protein (WzzB/FepE family)